MLPASPALRRTDVVAWIAVLENPNPCSSPCLAGWPPPFQTPAQVDGEILAWGRPADFPGRERAAEVRANGEPRTCLQQCQL